MAGAPAIYEDRGDAKKTNLLFMDGLAASASSIGDTCGLLKTRKEDWERRLGKNEPN
jgi:hypothetical protein